MIIRGIVHNIKNIVEIFLSPRSPAAIYKNPFPFFAQIYVQLFNLVIIPLGIFKKNVECIVCNEKLFDFGKMAAVSTNYIGHHFTCLYCHSNARTRSGLFYLKDILPQIRFSILDIGPNSSTKLFFKKYEQSEYKSLDKFGNADYSEDVACMSSIADERFDFVMCIHVLEHIENDIQAMLEINRVLKKTGIAVIMVPQIKGLKDTQKIEHKPFKGYGHIWNYGDDFGKRLERCNFDVEEIKFEDKELIKKYGLMAEKLYIAKKM